MLIQSLHPAPTWVGLLIAGEVGSTRDAAMLQEVLGTDGCVLLVDATDSPFAIVHRMVGTGASSVLAMAHRDAEQLLAPLLRIATSLASFRRIVVLHDAMEMASLLGLPGIVLLRDCPEVRASLRDIVTQDATARQRVPAITHSTQYSASWASGSTSRAAL